MSEDQRSLRGVGIGAGYFSHFHYDAWQRLDGVEIVALADLDSRKAKDVADQYGVPRTYEDYEEMVAREQPDFVDVITPPDTHLDICSRLAQSPVAVICQKPLAPDFSTAAEIVNMMERAGRRFMVHENWRWQPWYREIDRLRRRGELGEIFSIYFRLRTGDGWGEDAYLDRQPYFREYPRLFMFETGVHFVDTFRFLLGEPVRVFSHHRRLNPVIRGEDFAQVWMGFNSGASALLDANRYNEPDPGVDPRYTFGVMRLDGSKAHVNLEADGSIFIKPLGEEVRKHAYDPPKTGFAGDSCFALQRHFRDCMLSGEPFESEGSDYLKTLKTVEACYESAERGKVVHLKT